ncbi:MAG: PIN domain-containing protein [Candidatus Competibacteraceae bacterium]
MMNKVFIDTAFIIALSIENDRYHSIAKSWAEHIVHNNYLMVTHQGILLEVGDAFAKPQWRKMALELINYLQHDPTVEIVTISPQLLDDAIQLFASRNDKNWGLTDCLSFIIMQKLNLKAALTADQHFSQAGFRALLKETPV